jgi:AcrR family transcriptional regulator
MMENVTKKEDLRIIKTHKALQSALGTLLESRSFNKITVYDICKEAMVSRATFYVHFRDKYDLLSFWLNQLKKDYINKNYKDESYLWIINKLFHENMKILSNLMKNTDKELLQILSDFLSPEIYLSPQEKDDNQMSLNHMILSKFCAGGLLNLFVKEVNHKFLPENPITITYIAKMLAFLLEWDAMQDIVS